MAPKFPSMRRYMATSIKEMSREEAEAFLSNFSFQKPLFDSSKLDQTLAVDFNKNSVINVQKKTIFPFAYLPDSVALDIALNSANRVAKRYEEFVDMTTTRKDSFDVLDAAMDYEEMFNSKVEWKSIVNVMEELKLKYPEGSRESFTSLLNRDDTFEHGPLDELIESIITSDDAFLKYTFDDVTFLFVELLRDIETTENQQTFLSQLNQLFESKILKFHDQDLIHIITSLLNSAKDIPEAVTVVKTISKSYNSQTQLNDGNNAFFSRAPIPMVNSYLEASLKIGDLPTSKPLLDRLIKECYLPSKDTVSEYIQLSASLCSQLPVDLEQKRLLFNSLTSSLKRVVIEKDMLNTNIVESTVQFAKYEHLDLLICYFKLSPQYQDLKREIMKSVVRKLDLDQDFISLTDKERSIQLTSLLYSIGIQSQDEISDNIRNEIIKLYANAKSPLACILWAQVSQKNQLHEDILQRLDVDRELSNNPTRDI